MNETTRPALALRERDPMVVALTNSLLAAGVENLSLAHLDRAERYVAMDTRINARHCAVFISLQQLIDHWLGEATLPADQMDEAITWRFVKDAFMQFGLPTPSNDLLWQMPSGLARQQDHDTPLLRLAGAPFDIFLPELPADFRDEYDVLHPELSVAMQMTLGTLLLPASTLCGVAAGDVIRVPGRTGTASVAGQPLFLFQIHGDYLMIETPLFDGQPESATDTTGSRARGRGRVRIDDALDVERGFGLMGVEAGLQTQGRMDVEATRQNVDSEDVMSSLRNEGPMDVEASLQNQGPMDLDASLRIENLPVAVSFVLSRCDIRVAQLCALRPGMTLPLAQSTPYVDVMAGAVRLARGELVRVGGELGVELTEVFSPAPGRPEDCAP